MIENVGLVQLSAVEGRAEISEGDLSFLHQCDEGRM
jgi:hypothetical protein